MGITLVVLLLLQLSGVLILWDWQEEAFRQLVVERLINQVPMAFVGLLLMYLSSRLEEDATVRRPPILWVVCVCSGLLAVLLTVSLPISFNVDQALQDQANQQLASQRNQLEMARQQSQDPAFLNQIIAQAEASGQISGDTDDEKRQQATTFLDRQLEQLEKQVKQAEQASKVTINQKRFAGTYGAIVLIVALTLLCLGSVL